MHGLISVVLAEGCIVVLAIFLAILFRKRLLETLFLSSGLVILTLFIFGLLGFRGSLLFGYWAVLCLSIAAAVLSARNIYSNKSLIGQVDLWRGLFVIGVFSIFSLFVNYHRWFISWDEFSHWGIVVKHMYSLDALGSIYGSRLLFPDYFPGISLFEYFFTRASSTFVEYPVYIASNFLFFSMAVTFIKKIDVKSVLFTMAFIFGPLIVGTASSAAFFSNILVDIIMGCIFGFSVIVYLRYWHDVKDVFAVILLSTSLAILTISKDIGIVLALLVVAVCALDMLLYKRKEVSRVFVKKMNFKTLKQLALLMLPLITIFISWLLYKLNLKLSGVQSSWQGVNLSDLLTGNLKDYQVDVIKNFWRNFFSVSEYPIPLSFFWSMVVLLGVLVLWSIFIKNRSVAKRMLTVGISLFMGAFLYGLLIMSLYVLIFSEYEAVRLASYERYMGTYLTGFIIFVVGTFLYETRYLSIFYKRHRSTSTLMFFFGAVLLGFLISRATGEGRLLYDVAHARQEVTATVNIRAPYEVAKQWAPCLNDQNDKLNIIATNTKGNERNILLYTLYPIKAQTYYRFDFTVGEKPYETGDIWTLITSPEGWRGYIESNYTLIYVYRYDETFKNSYGRYFDNLKNDQLYRVEKTSNKLELQTINSNNCLVSK